jgi:hypothetical protein
MVAYISTKNKFLRQISVDRSLNHNTHTKAAIQKSSAEGTNIMGGRTYTLKTSLLKGTPPHRGNTYSNICVSDVPYFDPLAVDTKTGRLRSHNNAHTAINKRQKLRSDDNNLSAAAEPINNNIQLSSLLLLTLCGASLLVYIFILFSAETRGEKLH